MTVIVEHACLLAYLPLARSSTISNQALRCQVLLGSSNYSSSRNKGSWRLSSLSPMELGDLNHYIMSRSSWGEEMTCAATNVKGRLIITVASLVFSKPHTHTPPRIRAFVAVMGSETGSANFGFFFCFSSEIFFVY
jgi:hypothetical protein